MGIYSKKVFEASSTKGKDNEETGASPYEVIQTLVENGHDKDKIFNEYSVEEVELFYQKCIKNKMRGNADFIESIIAGIGASFGGSKEVKKVINKLRE